METDPAAVKLAEIKRIAACLLPLNRKPSLMAEQVAEYVTPLLAAVEAVLKEADKPSTGIPPVTIRRIITAALAGAGKEGSEDA